jgi:predicted RNA-binding Zn ribbon-like protein
MRPKQERLAEVRDIPTATGFERKQGESPKLMQWIATERISGLTPAPGGLAFVQDVLNTCSDGRPGAGHVYDDLLRNLASARSWLAAAGQALGESHGLHLPVPLLSQEDVPALRELRSELRRLVSGQGEAGDCAPLSRLRPASVTVQVAPGPQFVSLPNGHGWHWVASAVLAECFSAQEDNTWRRLKACRNPACPATFYDRTRNNNGVWHSVRSCGNPANLRASRARKRHDPGESHMRPL